MHLKKDEIKHRKRIRGEEWNKVQRWVEIILPVCDMFMLPLLACEGVPPFPDTDFGRTAYLVGNTTPGLPHPPTWARWSNMWYESITADGKNTANPDVVVLLGNKIDLQHIAVVSIMYLYPYNKKHLTLWCYRYVNQVKQKGKE